jgi:hypothetical protein
VKALDDVCEFFSSFPKSRFDVVSVRNAVSGSVGDWQVREILKVLVGTGYLGTGPERTRNGWKAVYWLNQPSD